jgi:hypothetical protein
LIVGFLSFGLIFTPPFGNGPVAQWIEQQPSKLSVIGSSPIRITSFENQQVANQYGLLPVFFGLSKAFFKKSLL